MASNSGTTGDNLDRLWTVVRANPRSTAFVALAHGLCDAGRVTEAEEVSRRGLAEHPRLATAQVALARSLFESGRIGESQELLIDTAKANPDYGESFRLLGEVVLRRGDLARARAILEHAEELLPQDGRTANLLMKAGGVPTVRAPRAKSDFENTRVADAHALARQMREGVEADAGAGTAGDDPPLREAASEDPTLEHKLASAQPSAAVPVPVAPRAYSQTNRHMRLATVKQKSSSGWMVALVVFGAVVVVAYFLVIKGR